MDNPFEMLHCHSSKSDGKLSYEEILDLSSRINIGVVAFCDHDGVINNASYLALKKQASQTKWISGIEVSSTQGHIIGLFVNPFEKNLVEYCIRAQKARVERMEKMVKNLVSLGFDITVDDCLEASKGEAVGRPHIIEAIKQKPKNIEIIAQLKAKMSQEAKNKPKVKEKYEEMLKRGEEEYPYYLFMDKESFIKNIYVDYTFRLSLDEAVKLIRDAQGKAFFAHWFTEKKRLPLNDMENLLSADRLDGIETLYGLGVLDRKKIMSQSGHLRELVQKYHKLESGSSDAHSREDFELFSKQSWFSSQTIGMAQKIIQNSKVNLDFSSYK